MKRFLRYEFPWIVWMVGIFVFSSQTGQDSDRTSFVWADLLREILPVSRDLANGMIRKSAHMAEYAVLSWLTARVLLHRFRLCRPFPVAFCFSVLYAVGDEVHQIFVPRRIGSAVDVGIDTIGILIGLGIYSFCRRQAAGKRNHRAACGREE